MVTQSKQPQHRLHVICVWLEDVLLNTIVENELDRELAFLTAPLLGPGCLNVGYLPYLNPAFGLLRPLFVLIGYGCTPCCWRGSVLACG